MIFNNPDLLPSFPDLVQKKKEEIKACYQEDVFKNAQGIIFVVGVDGPDGVELDVKNVESTFKQLNFAVHVVRNPTAMELACLLEAAGNIDYPDKYEYVAFYFAGHGGINKDDKSFVVGLQRGNKKVLGIKEYIIEPLEPLHTKHISCLFFFDCCQLKTYAGVEFFSGIREMPEYAGEVVAYATNVGQYSSGDKIYGGIWTHHLCKNLRKLVGETLQNVLARTYVDVTKTEKSFQEPYTHFGAGPIILNKGRLLVYTCNYIVDAVEALILNLYALLIAKLLMYMHTMY